MNVQEGYAVDLSVLLRQKSIDAGAISRFLDSLSPAARLQTVRRLSSHAQANLFEAVAGARTLSLEDLVPRQVATGVEVPHHGKNTLPVFQHFAKVFCRGSPDARELWGYNRCSRFIETFVGPGYYVAYQGDAHDVWIDYTRVPTQRPASWPPIIPNEARLGRFVYAGMVDVLRSVSRHVSIGRAIRNGKTVDNWFVLCRALD